MIGKLAILGAGGHGRVIGDSAAALGWQLSFFDDAATSMPYGWELAGKACDLVREFTHFDGVIVAIGNNQVRLKWLRQLSKSGVPLATIIDASAQVSPRADVSLGCFLAAKSVVNIGARIGAGCIINTAATVDHDCVLADGVHLSPGVHLSGAVTIGEASWLGTGSSVRNNINIGADVIAGVGSVVVKDIGDGQIVAGVPAQPLEKSEC